MGDVQATGSIEVQIRVEEIFARRRRSLVEYIRRARATGEVPDRLPPMAYRAALDAVRTLIGAPGLRDEEIADLLEVLEVPEERVNALAALHHAWKEERHRG